MSARVRFRKLSGSINWSEFDNALAHEGGGRRASPFTVAVAAANTPKNVSASEGEAEFHEVSQMLEQGQLSPRDLVFEDGRWIDFESSMQFADAAEPAVDRANRNHRLMIGFAICFGIATAVSLFIYALT